MFNPIAMSDPMMRDGSIQRLFQTLFDPNGQMMMNESMIDPYGLQLSEMMRMISGNQSMGDRGMLGVAQMARGNTGGIAGRPTTAAYSPLPSYAPNRGVGNFIQPLPGFSVPIVTPNMPRPMLPMRDQNDESSMQIFGRGDSNSRANAFRNLFGGRFPRPF